ncbi:MAG TPA: VOC family protein [Rhodospirillales bacterium]|nr:VOC family protein [Rhodospirillales bacterium]
MRRGIDHLVMCVRDLEAARKTYETMGFTTTPRAVHPFGTGNFLVQLQGNFLELLTVLDAAKIPPMEPGRYSFAAFSEAFLEKRQGMSTLVLQSEDARRDLAEFAEKGLRTYEPVDFSRKATLPDGSQVTVSFSLAFVSDEAMPEAGFFACQHHHPPEYFWKPQFQTHANGVQRIIEVFMVADEPASAAGFYEHLYGPENVAAADGALTVETGQERITVLGPARFAARFPGVDCADAPATPHFAGYRLVVADLDAMESLLSERVVAFRKGAGSLWIAPEDAFGAVVEFAPENGA